MLKEFIDFRKNLKNGSISSVYVLWGEEDFFKSTLIKEIGKVYIDAELVRFSSDSALNNILNALEEDGFLSKRKLVVVSDFDELDQKEQNKIIKFIESKPLKDAVLILTAQKESKKLSEVKGVLSFECSKLKLYDGSIEQFINSVVKGTGYEIDETLVKYLISLYGEDLSLITNELKKAFSIKKKGSRITLDDLRKIMYVKPEDNVFKLAEYISQGDQLKCLNLLKDLALTEDNTIGLVHILYDHFRKLCMILDLSKDHFEIKDIASAIKLHYYITKELQKQANRLTLRRILPLFKDLCEIDFKQKSSDIDGFSLMQRFVIKACGGT